MQDPFLPHAHDRNTGVQRRHFGLVNTSAETSTNGGSQIACCLALRTHRDRIFKQETTLRGFVTFANCSKAGISPPKTESSDIYHLAVGADTANQEFAVVAQSYEVSPSSLSGSYVRSHDAFSFKLKLLYS